MTDPLDEMESGEALDCLIAEEVMGWTRNTTDHHTRYYYVDAKARSRYVLSEKPGIVLPLDWFNPSREIGAAWEVVDKMQAAPHEDFLSLDRKSGCFINESWRIGWEATFRMSEVFAVADTAPRAICIAALRAVRSMKPSPAPAQLEDH